MDFSVTNRILRVTFDKIVDHISGGIGGDKFLLDTLQGFLGVRRGFNGTAACIIVDRFGNTQVQSGRLKGFFGALNITALLFVVSNRFDELPQRILNTLFLPGNILLQPGYPSLQRYNLLFMVF